MKEFIDKTNDSQGTIVNREAMMAIQGFQTNLYEVLSDGTIIKKNDENHILTIYPFNVDGVRRIVFQGKKTIAMNQKINRDGSINEVIVND